MMNDSSMILLLPLTLAREEDRCAMISREHQSRLPAAVRRPLWLSSPPSRVARAGEGGRETGTLLLVASHATSDTPESPHYSLLRVVVGG